MIPPYTGGCGLFRRRPPLVWLAWPEVELEEDSWDICAQILRSKINQRFLKVLLAFPSEVNLRIFAQSNK